jgi:hypothetical protein
MVNVLKNRKELDHLKTENEIIDSMISQAVRQKIVSQFQVQDLKKKKLLLQESIFSLESALINNIVA